MRKLALLPAGLAAMLVALLSAAPAQAQNSKSFVSAAGSGTACTFTAPCAAFQTAHDATTPGGEIACLNSGDFGGAHITKSITIDCAGTAASAFFFGVNAAGSTVTVRNLTFFFSGTGSGIDFVNGAALLVENCLIQTNVGAGINFRPSAAGAELVVTDTVINNNGGGSSGGGVIVNPQSGGSAVVLLDRVTVANNVFGIVADGSASTAGINMTIRNSDAHRNTQDGIVATTVAGQAPIGILVKNTASLSNNNGMRATGPGVTVRADNVSVSGNGTGLVVNNGAALLSYGNNNVDANGTNGAFSGPVTLK